MKSIKHLSRCIIYYVLLVSGLFYVNTQPKPILLVTGEIPPYVSEEMDGQGFITEIVALAMNHAGIEFELEFYPWKRCVNMVETGQAWAAFPYAYNEERSRTFLFSETVGLSVMKFFYYKAPPVSEYVNLEDLKDYRMGGVLGYYYESLFSNAGIPVDFTATEVQSINKLKAGRIDLLPLNEIVGWQLIREHFPREVENFGTLELPLQRIELKLMVLKWSPSSQRLLQQFNSSLQAVQKTPAFSEILGKYGISNSQLASGKAYLD